MEETRIIEEYRAKIEEEKGALAQLRAEKKIIEKDLKNEFGLSTVEEARKRLVRIKRQIETLGKEFSQKLREIQEEYPL